MSVVLVTGSAGFVGSELVPLLRAAGHSVVGVDVEIEARSDRFVRHDLAVGVPDLPPFDACIHLASAVGGILYNLRGDRFATNESIDANTLAACDRAGCIRAVYLSSINVFETSPTFEHAPLARFDQHSPYAVAKAHGERSFAARIRHCTVLRPTNIFGASQRRRHEAAGESHVIPDLLAKIERGGVVTVLGDGTQVRNFVHVRDVCAFTIRALAFEGTHHLNLRSDLTLTIDELVVELVRFTGAKVTIEHDPSYMRFESFRIRQFDMTVPRELGWRTTVGSIAEGLR